MLRQELCCCGLGMDPSGRLCSRSGFEGVGGRPRRSDAVEPFRPFVWVMLDWIHRSLLIAATIDVRARGRGPST